MPPTSNAASASAKTKSSGFSPSPDSEPIILEPTLTVTSKRKKKNAANRQTQNTSNDDRVSTPDVTRPDTPPAARPQTILSQLGHAFPSPAQRQAPLLDLQDEGLESHKVSDQYTPPIDTWMDQDIHTRQPTRGVQPASPPAEPGFSTRARYDSKSPPISPPTRYARPVSYTNGVPPIPPISRASPSSHALGTRLYGSPPAPHLPQPHFYHAQDINIGLPQVQEDPAFVRYVGKNKAGLLLGFEGRLNGLSLENGVPREHGVLDGLHATVIDAVTLDPGTDFDEVTALRPMVAVILHGPQQIQFGPDKAQEEARNDQPECSTRVEVFSLKTHERLALLLETPMQPMQSTFRGVAPTPPSPVGQLKLQSSGPFLVVTCGASGEVYAFAIQNSPHPKFECLGKFWTAMQPQAQRRDSSRHQISDVDISPADLSRGGFNSSQAIACLKGRWLAVCPPSPPSRPSLGARIGPEVSYGRYAGLESSSAPARPSLTCEVESPDADTFISKMARGVAQEVVKGAKWLGDQSYSTWQSVWRKESIPPLTTPAYTSPPLPPAPYGSSTFPPTHGEMQRISKDPEMVAIYDLEIMIQSNSENRPLAAFQPPGGCSFLSLAPHGLTLLSASRKGDVQYLWDLMQIKYARVQVNPSDEVRAHPRVRQIAKYERLSGSTIVDVAWDSLAGSRFAVLTKNKTVHLFDLPSSAFRWPPPRSARQARSTPKSVDNTTQDASFNGFFASAINIANQAQPIIAGWRGRAPSMSGGLAGFGQTSIGLASATGVRGGKAVAAGLSKSLGAASETVSQIRHAGESRLHLKSNKGLEPGRIFWTSHGRSRCLAIVELDSVKLYQVQRNKERITVFAARKAVVTKLPVFTRSEETAEGLTGYWPPISMAVIERPLAHPLSFAEIETNAPYQPFHSDRRVGLSVYTPAKQGKSNWIFGDDIPIVNLKINKIQIPEADDDYTGSVIYRETIKVASSVAQEDLDQIVSTTRRRKLKKDAAGQQLTESDAGKDDGFFEDDCDVLDFATDRV